MNPTQTGTCEWLAAELERARLLDSRRLQVTLNELHERVTEPNVHQFAEYLVQRKLLTPFQVERVLEGEARKLVLGPYLLIDSIGAGGMGTVFRAEGRGDREPYAVKVLPLRSLWNVRLARKQVRAFSSLPSNPAVVPFVDVGSAVGVHYLVWPFVEGTPLERLVRERGPLEADEVASLAIQLAEGLHICHRHQLYHGLFKPTNVLIAADGTVRITDFGLGAILADNIDDEESLIDTISTANATANMLDCAAPESLSDPTRRDALGDQYSLGCTLYYAVTGQYPFPVTGVVEKMVAHQTKHPTPIREFNPDIPRPLESVITRLMQKAPEARYGDLGEIIMYLAPLSPRPVSLAPKRISTNESIDPAGIRSGKFLRQPKTIGLGADEFDVKPLPKPPAPARIDPPAKPTPKAPERSETPPKLPPTPAKSSSVPEPLIPLTEPRRPSPVEDHLASSPFDVPLPPKPSVEPLNHDSFAVEVDDQRIELDPPTKPPVQQLAMPDASPDHRLNVILPPPPKVSLTKKVTKAVFFWAPPADRIQCSLFAVPVVRGGSRVSVNVFVHHPLAARAVMSLAANFGDQTFAVGAGYLSREIDRQSRLALFLDLQHSEVNVPLQDFVWQGQPELFALQVSVESDAPPGPMQGILSVGQDEVLVGQIPFELTVE